MQTRKKTKLALRLRQSGKTETKIYSSGKGIRMNHLTPIKEKVADDDTVDDNIIDPTESWQDLLAKAKRRLYWTSAYFAKIADTPE